jgi:hypothetical protein
MSTTDATELDFGPVVPDLLLRCPPATLNYSDRIISTPDFKKQDLRHMPFVSYGRNVNNRRSRQERISQRAFFNWLSAGQPDGRDQEFWFAAEEEERRSFASKESDRGRALPSERFSRVPRTFWPIT